MKSNNKAIMRKLIFIFLTTKRWLQLILLVSLLFVGWLLASVLRWVKGEGWYQKQKTTLLPGILGINSSRADVPGIASTPFLAVWNGKEYEIENDFLFGKPFSYFANFTQGKKIFETGQIGPDLYKIQSPIEPKNGKLAFQIQEIEPEESFISGLSLLRVIHPRNSEVIVDSDYRRFYVVNKKSFLQRLIAPSLIKSSSGRNLTHLFERDNFWAEPPQETFLGKQDYVDLTFRNLKPGKKYFLAHQSRYRVWVMGEGPSVLAQAQSITSLLIRSQVAKAAFATLLSFSFFGMAKGISWLPNVLFALCESCGTGDSSGGGGPGDPGSQSPGDFFVPYPCCLPVFYKSAENKLCYAGTIEPRAWRCNSELLELPKQAVLNSGEMYLRISSTQYHCLGFVGLVEEPLNNLTFTLETIKLERAYHRRLEKEVTDQVNYQRGRYLHTIPGDTVDLEFELPKTDLSIEEKETYLLSAAGFYTFLTPFSKMIAGKWEEKLSPQARERLELIKQEQSGA